MGDRRLISFRRDIVDDVVRESGGRWTREQVNQCFMASIALIHHVCRYTDYLSCKVPHIGDMVCNLHEMVRRRRKLRRILEEDGRLDERKSIELACLERKIPEAERLKASGEVRRGHPLVRHEVACWKMKRYGHPFEWFQDLQDTQFGR